MRKQDQFSSTLTIFVIGYQLPEHYKIGDLRYFAEFNIDVK
jgi:hypothetical protein